MDRFEADYLIETAWPLADAAAAMAGEQSSGTFLPVPGETEALKARAAARVVAVQDLGPVAAPSLPGAGRADQPHRQGLVTLSWPLANIGPSLPNLLATIAGNLFELKQFSGLKLLDVRLPRAFGDAYAGPAFGIAGTRRLAGVDRGALVGTIIKPSVGLTADETAAMVDQLCAAGIDFIKDDELQADGPACPFADRVSAVMKVINTHADRTGRKVMFAFNLTGEVDDMRTRHDIVMAHGGTCIMASLNSVGLSGLTALRRHAQLPIHAHRNGWGAISRHPALGFSYIAWSKLWRVAGVDHLHVNGIRNKFCESDESSVASALSLTVPLWEDKPCAVMPVFSSGQSAAQVHETHAALGSGDAIYAAGGGIMAHPMGPAAGVASIRAAWDAAMAGIPLDRAAAADPALKAALGRFA